MKFLAKNMDGLSRDAGLEISDLRVAAVLIFVILNLAVFLLRLVSVWRYGALFGPDSSLAIYPVWKGVHHLPIYEWPLAYPFSLALYNYLFYNTYAFFLRLIGASGADILIWGRFLTPVFSIIGAIAQWKLVQHHLNLRGAHSALSLIFALGLWFCTSMVRHWALCIRPDMGAVALVMAALYMVVRGHGLASYTRACCFISHGHSSRPSSWRSSASACSCCFTSDGAICQCWPRYLLR